MLTRQFLSEKLSQGMDYDEYVATGTAEQQRRWKQVYDRAQIGPLQQALLSSFTRHMNLLVISGVWCGDCIQQIPLIHRIVQATPKGRIDLRILDRDAHRDLMQPLRINDGERIPVVLLLSEDHEFCSLAGDRTLARYRAMAQRQLGAACITGIVPPEQEEMSLTLQDWLDEVERVQLMLRLSPRLRQRYAD